MATSGSKTVAATAHNNLVFSWSESGQSIANNTTTVSWTLKLTSGKYGYISSSANKAWSVTVNGQSYSGTNKIGIAANSSKTLASGATVIAHNADGTKSFNFSFSQELSITFSGSWVGTISGSGSGTLDTIPRVSSFSLSASSVEMGQRVTLTINKAASSFTDKLYYDIGKGWVKISDNVLSGASWVVPLDFASSTPNSTSLTVTLGLDTFSGNTYIGTAVQTFKATVPANIKPTCRIQVLDATPYKDTYGNLVQGLSKLTVNVTGVPSYGSPIADYKTTVEGTIYPGASIKTAVLKKAGTVTVESKVKDKRGRTSAAASASFPVIEYHYPVISALSVHRCDADGSENEAGEYINVTFSASISPLNNKNSAAYTLRYKKTAATDYTEVQLTELAGVYEVTDASHVFVADGNSSYNVEIVATDDIKSTPKATSASTAFTLTNWGEEGTSIAFGKVAEASNTFQNALHLNQLGNRYAHSSPGVAGAQGFVLMANIEITAANADTPITFVLSRRQEPTTMTVHVALRNSNMDASSVGSIKYEGTNYDAYLSPTGDMSWGLYVLKGSNYDTITIQDWYTSRTMQSRVQVTFPGTLVDQVPVPYYKATPAALDSIRDYLYPVGSIYLSYSHYDPADMFGGTWVRIENAFLWGCDKDGSIGVTGGEKTHTLTVNEIPSHSHGAVYSGTAGVVGETYKYAWYLDSGDKMAYGTISTGGGAAHNNMPPYVQISIWRRTA